MSGLSRQWATLLLGAGLGFGMSQAWADKEAEAWLEKMNQALATRNYDGTFLHMRYGKGQLSTVEKLRIIHRVENDRVTERLVSLDGSGREIIRNEDQLTCFLPDQRRVVVSQRPPRGALMGRLPAFDETFNNYYALQPLKQGRVSGRKTQIVTVTPKDGYRYGYCLWLDDKTGMPLQTQLRDARGELIEQVVFSDLALFPRIPRSEVQPQVRSEGFQWIRQQLPQLSPSPAEITAWRAVRVPPGFKLQTTRSQTIEGSNFRRSQLVYSDGLASVSVFIEQQSPQAEALQGTVRLGSAYTFSTVVQGYQVTAVGEVPVQTVKLIAASTRPGN